ncbi:hypothetical protein BpHYR1_006636 [Brachionus plicatilis]|uniref:Uncharacterized protein n=1 Tax=Brachionus plicatilis TaxID=10195 RepID=A0A3M7SEZ3_BRAPC|nr:hypothetical protein BpHYR1_006636 [Brachionus plicatilis]
MTLSILLKLHQTAIGSIKILNFLIGSSRVFPGPFNSFGKEFASFSFISCFLLIRIYKVKRFSKVNEKQKVIRMQPSMLHLVAVQFVFEIHNSGKKFLFFCGFLIFCQLMSQVLSEVKSMI